MAGEISAITAPEIPMEAPPEEPPALTTQDWQAIAGAVAAAAGLAGKIPTDEMKANTADENFSARKSNDAQGDMARMATSMASRGIADMGINTDAIATARDSYPNYGTTIKA